jgi:hypothetical protein
VFYITAAVMTVAAIIYLVFQDSDLAEWAELKEEKNDVAGERGIGNAVSDENGTTLTRRKSK